MRAKTPTKSTPNQGRLNQTAGTRFKPYRQPEADFSLEMDESDEECLKKKKAYNIVQFLDQRDREHKHKYKYFMNHSKVSDLSEIKSIIEQLLNKHAVEETLTSSEQYILIGYLHKYLQLAQNNPKLRQNPFNLIQRVETHNKHQLIINEEHPLSPKHHKYSTARTTSKYPQFNRSKGEEKRTILLKDLEKIKFLWQIYQLKTIACPNLSRATEAEQTENRRQLLQMVGKLKAMERMKDKIGEEKAMQQVGKIMRRFQARIRSLMI